MAAEATSTGAAKLDRYLLGLSLKRAQHELRLAINEELASLGTNISQLNVLYQIKLNAGLSNAELARRAFLTPQALGQQVIQLEKRRLVERRAGAGRTIRHELTTEGDRLLSVAMQKAAEVSEHVLAEFDEAELAQLLEAFETIVRRSTQLRARRRALPP